MENCQRREFFKISELACFDTECFRKISDQSKTKRAGAENIAQRGISEHFVSSKILREISQGNDWLEMHADNEIQGK